MPLVPFAAWRPDVDALNGSFSPDMQNVLYGNGILIPFPMLMPYSEAVSDQPLGGITVRAAGLVHIFVGTAGKLWKYNASTNGWVDVSKPATTYSASTDERWRFRQFGNYVIAANVNDVLQYFEVGVSTEFADVPGSPPRARNLAVCNDRLLLFNGRTVSWCDTDDISDWSSGTAGSQTFPDGGDIQGATDTTNPIIVQEKAIRFGTFLPGSPVAFTFQKIHDKRGAISPYAVASRGEFLFFADAGAFCQVSPDGQVLPIGAEKVDRSIFRALGGGNKDAVYCEIDPFFPRAYFAIKVSSASDAFDRLIVYDWQVQEWSQIETSVDILFPLSGGTPGVTLDDIEDALEDLEFSLDSSVWEGGSPLMAAFDENFRLGFFSGGNAEATITTQEMGDTAGQLSLVTAVYPVVDTDQVAVAFGCRFRRHEVFMYAPERSPSSNTGIVRGRCRGRFHRFRVRIEQGADWNAAQGIDVTVQPAGFR
jgi:hypothetical protein